MAKVDTEGGKLEASCLSNMKHIGNVNGKIVSVQNPNKHSLKTIAELKKFTNLSDKYHIFVINCRAFNNTGDC